MESSELLAREVFRNAFYTDVEERIPDTIFGLPTCGDWACLDPDHQREVYA